ncbi:MAG: apolipoprotein N-acyltransferase, partial [Chlamydiota bacterium]
HILALAGLWTLFEWSRLFWLSGFAWNPVGMSLASCESSVQMASLFGVYGLSFWVILTNLFGYRFFFLERTKTHFVLWSCCTLFPYFFGIGQEVIVKKFFPNNEKLSVVLVQTALFPEEKEPFFEQEKKFIPPLDQWMRIFSILRKSIKDQKVDLLVFPETTVPFRALTPIYPLYSLQQLFLLTFGETSLVSFPPLKMPLIKRMEEGWRGSNLYIAQALSNYFGAEVVIGLDDYDRLAGKNANAAFHITPGKPKCHRYEKRVLVPVAEYFPFSWCSSIASHYGIMGAFTPGKSAKVFGEKVRFSPSICYEETFGESMREGRVLGAELFINITNDVWFPYSRLAREHFEHGRVRAVENGIPVVRSCNTGITGAIDCFGHIVATLGSKKQNQERLSGALYVSLPLQTYKTLYSFIGDMGIILLSCSCILLYIGSLAWVRYRKKRLCETSLEGY